MPTSAGSELIPAARPWSHTATIVEIAKYRSSQRHAVQGVRKLLLTETDSAGGVSMCFVFDLVGRTHVDLRYGSLGVNPANPKQQELAPNPNC